MAIWNKQSVKPDLQRFSGKTSLIAVGAELVGDMRFDGAVQVDGRVQGNMCATDGLIRISAGGLVEGEISASYVLIEGEVLGEVHANVYLELGPRGRVRGNLHYALMEMASGAQIEGCLYPMSDSEHRLPLPELVTSSNS